MSTFIYLFPLNFLKITIFNESGVLQFSIFLTILLINDSTMNFDYFS